VGTLGVILAITVVVVRWLLVTTMSAASVVAPAPASTTAGPAAPSTAGPTAPSTASSGACGSPACPVGVTGDWSVSFEDEFDGTSLDTSRWSAMDGQSMNQVTTLASNISVAGGYLTLELSDTKHGAAINSSPSSGAGAHGYLLPVGSYTEARVEFPGSGTLIYNWPAWWTSSGSTYRTGGEHDIAEALGSLWTVYHGSTEPHYGASVPGTWSNAFHVYGLYRGDGHADVYWDGVKVASYDTSDDGSGQGLIVNVGCGPYGGSLVTGAASQVKVDYVRAWKPAG
jgi:hypothetical protein